MELLLIHQNHPGQFRDLTPALEHRGHRLLGLGATPRGQRLDYGWQPPALPEGLADHLLETSLRRAARVQERCLQLRADGYRPDAVLGHSGWGELLYLRDIWPEAVLIAYPELYAAPLLLGYGFDADLGAPSHALRAQWRRGNLMALAAVADADACVVPTRFARDTFPHHLRGRFHVLHEGIALPVAASGSTSLRLEGGPTLVRGDPVITFASRNLEPLRGFRSFLRALPAVLAARPDARATRTNAAPPRNRSRRRRLRPGTRRRGCTRIQSTRRRRRPAASRRRASASCCLRRPENFYFASAARADPSRRPPSGSPSPSRRAARLSRP